MQSLLYALAFLVLVALPAQAEITGKPRIIEGDTIMIDEQAIRFFGIDTPEIVQLCNGPKALRKCREVAAAAGTALQKPREQEAEPACPVEGVIAPIAVSYGVHRLWAQGILLAALGVLARYYGYMRR